MNDVENTIDALKSLGFEAKPEVNTRVLLEKERRKPNRAEILDSMKWLVTGARPGDVLWLHFSGHGSQVKDKSGAEADGLNESIVPLDFRTAGMIVDEDLYATLVKPLPAGATLFCIFDCCHSGSDLLSVLPAWFMRSCACSVSGGVLDLKYIYDESTNTLINDPSIRDRKENEGHISESCVVAAPLLCVTNKVCSCRSHAQRLHERADQRRSAAWLPEGLRRERRRPDLHLPPAHSQGECSLSSSLERTAVADSSLVLWSPSVVCRACRGATSCRTCARA